MRLREYKAKRDFTKTTESPPEKKTSRGKQPLFVIQKHAASTLHYDFRLELDSVLKSWAVPKGVPFKKGDKRLAMHVEDHPLDYAHFEGTIPAGQYGGGTVMVWDTGTWEPLSADPARDLENGKLRFALHGEKLNGEWTLLRFGGGKTREGKQWLLLKSGASIKPVSRQRDEESVLTGRTMEQIAGDKSAVWRSKPTQKKSKPAAKPRPSKKARKNSRKENSGMLSRRKPGSRMSRLTSYLTRQPISASSAFA